MTTIQASHFDLCSRARLALNCLAEHTSPENSFQPYFYSRFNDHPPSASLYVWSYGDGAGRAVEAMVFIHAMLGVRDYSDREKQVIAGFLSSFRDDGLVWCPESRWNGKLEHTRPCWMQQGALLGLLALYQVGGEREHLESAKKLTDQLCRLAEWHADGSATYPGEYLTAEGWSPHAADLANRPSFWQAATAMPLLRLFALSGYEPALRLANGLVEAVLQDLGRGDGLFDYGHFHCQSRVTLSLLMRGLLLKDDKDVELAEKLYLRARALGTASGWFPEQIANTESGRNALGETCSTVDMIEIAILLGRWRSADYWFDAERFIRNHLHVYQINDPGWMSKIPEIPESEQILRYRVEFGYPDTGAVRTEGTCCGPEVADQLRGGFAGWGGVSAMATQATYSHATQHCCNASGARALYDAWYHALDLKDGMLSINLYLPRNHQAAEVTVCEQDQGVLAVSMRQAANLRIRRPFQTDGGSIRVTKNSEEIEIVERDGFISVGAVRPGDKVEVHYALNAVESVETVPAGSFVFSWKGHSVTSVSPEQEYGPLFRPERLAQNGCIESKMPLGEWSPLIP